MNKEYIKICEGCLKRFEKEIKENKKHYDIEIVPFYNCRLMITHMHKWEWVD